MNPIKQQIINWFNKKFKSELEEQKKFFSKPDTLMALGALGLSMLTKWLVKEISEDEIKKFIRTDKTARDFMSYNSKDLDEQILSDLLLKCQNGEITEEQYLDYLKDEDISAEGFIGIADKLNDFNVKTGLSFENLNAYLNKNRKTVNQTLSYSFLFYYIVLQTIDLIKNSEHPSPYRMKFIQRLIRNLTGIMKHQWKTISDKERAQWETMIKNLKKIDNLLLGLGMASALYLINRRLLHKRSEEALQEIAKDKVCIDISNPDDIQVNILPFKDSLECPVELDDVITPHVPIEVKLENVSCELPENEENILDANEAVDLETKAIIRNKRVEKMIPVLTTDSFVDQKTIIANLSFPVYSPIEGFISDQQTDQIILRDIKDPDEDYLTTQINLLSEKYTRLSNIKAFLKSFNVKSLYPVIISGANPVPLPTAIKGSNKIYDLLVKAFDVVDKDYDKQIKKISGEDNVKKHAENETLIEIKEQIDKEDVSYLKWLKDANGNAKKSGFAATTIPTEYFLSSYYTALVKPLKEKKEPNTIEVDFRNKINEFIEYRKAIINNTKVKTDEEANYIQLFFNNLWKEYESIPGEIDTIQAIINNLTLFSTYSIIEYEGEQYRLYTIPEPTACKPGDANDELNPNTKYGFDDIRYWIKYCSIATLASIANPATGWSTGFILPATILFPVVYIPIKSINTKYGFIVIGISVCGMYVFPWVLFVNYTTNYSLPLLDPTIALKNEIKALKKGVSEQLAIFKKSYLKIFLNQTKEKLDEVKKELADYKVLLEQHKLTKPSKYPKLDKIKIDEQILSKIEPEINKNIEYVKNIEKWLSRGIELRELIAKTSIKKWRLEQQYSVLDSAIKNGTSVKEVDSKLKNQEQLITKQLDTLNKAVDNLEKVIMTLPIAMKPNSANFGITLKNPKPLIKIADALDDNVNNAALDQFYSKYKLKNADLMSSQYSAKLSKSITNFNKYKAALGLAMPLIIKKDPFPKYENLKLTNLPWIAFLYTDFVTMGAETFGFPGFPPYPI